MKWYLFVILGMGVVILFLVSLLLRRKKRIAGLRAGLDAYLKTGKPLPGRRGARLPIHPACGIMHPEEKN